MPFIQGLIALNRQVSLPDGFQDDPQRFLRAGKRGGEGAVKMITLEEFPGAAGFRFAFGRQRYIDPAREPIFEILL